MNFRAFLTYKSTLIFLWKKVNFVPPPLTSPKDFRDAFLIVPGVPLDAPAVVCLSPFVRRRVLEWMCWYHANRNVFTKRLKQPHNWHSRYTVWIRYGRSLYAVGQAGQPAMLSWCHGTKGLLGSGGIQFVFGMLCKSGRPTRIHSSRRNFPVCNSARVARYTKAEHVVFNSLSPKWPVMCRVGRQTILSQSSALHLKVWPPMQKHW